MPDRNALADAFLAQTAWKTAPRTPLAGDASTRRYFRLEMPETGRTAILMDAPHDARDSIRPYLLIANHLRMHGFSAPEIIASDPKAGFVLLEDLGDALYARLVHQRPELEQTIYSAAIEMLAGLHGKQLPAGVPIWTAARMAEMAGLVFDHYQDNADRTAPEQKQAFLAEMERALAPFFEPPHVLCLRDFHAENLLWLPARHGVGRVGLLDFQDAFAGHPAYDLVSLLEDARRDVAPNLRQKMIALYISKTGVDPADFNAAFAVFGVQRNLRILGIFARLAIQDGKPGYIDLIPRVWRHVQDDLSNPALQALRGILRAELPEPTPRFLNQLKNQCATTQVQ